MVAEADAGDGRPGDEDDNAQADQAEGARPPHTLLHHALLAGHPASQHDTRLWERKATVNIVYKLFMCSIILRRHGNIFCFWDGLNR